MKLSKNVLDKRGDQILKKESESNLNNNLLRKVMIKHGKDLGFKKLRRDLIKA
jgi:hypothetical protein